MANQHLDIAWLLICAALVMLMQAGFSCLESGMVRSKNSINVAAKNFTGFCLSSAIFWLFGFGIMYGTSSDGLFGKTGFMFNDTANSWLMAFFIFQIGFCAAATSILSGAVAERMSFSGYLMGAAVISGIAYPVVGHWAWAGASGGGSGGWLQEIGFIDFAGGTVVHSVGGWIALASILIIGPRMGRFSTKRIAIHGHDLPMVTLGVFLLWFGWFGFNGGSTFGITPEVPGIIVNTSISGVFGTMVALLLVWRIERFPEVTMILNGSLAGLVGITASAHIMTPQSAAIIGSIAAVVMYATSKLLDRFHIDDAVGAVPVHLGAGVWGTLAVALFADPSKFGTGLGRWEQLYVQVIGIGSAFAWAFGIGIFVLSLIHWLLPMRIDPRGERVGLNTAEHGASTEILDLLAEMDAQRSANDYSNPVNVEPHTEIGQIARQYNQVLADINAEQERRKAVTENLRQQTKSLQLMQGTASAANQATTIEDAIQACLESICEFGNWQIGHCFMVEDSSKELVSTNIWHLDDATRFSAFRQATQDMKNENGLGLLGQALADGKPVWSNDIEADIDSSRQKVSEQIGIRYGAAFPVLVGEEVVALLEFFALDQEALGDSTPINRSREYYESVLGVMASVGTQLGRIVERERSEATRFKTVVDHMPAGVHLRDLDGRFILVNRNYEEFHGVENGFAKGKTLGEVSKSMNVEIPIDENLVSDREVINNNAIVEKEHFVVREGELRTVADTKFPILDATGKVTAVGGIQLDVTELKQAEEELQNAYEIIREQKERMEDELNIGREIQMDMIPLVFPPFPDRREFSIFAALEPAREVGGDFYDFHFVDHDKLCACIGDVSGKGVPSALFMAMTKTLLKSRANDDRSIASILTHVNDELSHDNESSMFATVFAAILDLSTGELTYTNAGHNPPYIKRKDGKLERLDQRHGPVVGAVEGIVYKEMRLTMQPGELLFLYTDGVTEAINSKGKFFSEERLSKKLAAKNLKKPEAYVSRIVGAVKTFAGEVEQADDITLLALKFHGTSDGELATQYRIVIKNQLSEIDSANDQFLSFARKFKIPGEISTKLNIVFDEVLNNIISYAYNDTKEHKIEIEIELSSYRLIVRFIDDGVPFNPLGIKAPDTNQSLEDRKEGGIGLHLVRSMVDGLSYQRKIDKNVMTLTKKL